MSKYNPDKDYHGADLYRPEWETPHDIRNWLSRSVFEGGVLNVCSGPSPLGDVTLDIDRSHSPTVQGSLHDLPFGDNAFDTVYVDPPYSEYSMANGHWPDEAWRVASQRLVLECPGKRVTIPRTEKTWYLAEPRAGSSLMAVKLFQVFTRAGADITDLEV